MKSEASGLMAWVHEVESRPKQNASGVPEEDVGDVPLDRLLLQLHSDSASIAKSALLSNALE